MCKFSQWLPNVDLNVNVNKKKGKGVNFLLSMDACSMLLGKNQEHLSTFKM